MWRYTASRVCGFLPLVRVTAVVLAPRAEPLEGMRAAWLPNPVALHGIGHAIDELPSLYEGIGQGELSGQVAVCSVAAVDAE